MKLKWDIDKYGNERIEIEAENIEQIDQLIRRAKKAGLGLTINIEGEK